MNSTSYLRQMLTISAAESTEKLLKFRKKVIQFLRRYKRGEGAGKILFKEGDLVDFKNFIFSLTISLFT